MEGNLSDFDRETFLRAFGRPSLRYPLTARHVVCRKEKDKFIVMVGDSIYLANEAVISLLEFCDGFHSVKEIITAFGKEYNLNFDEARKVTEEFLEGGSAKGLIYWIPLSPLHQIRAKEQP